MSEYISREEVLSKSYRTNDEHEQEVVSVTDIDSIPSADVRPNIHAYWEEDGHGHIICSACKEANVSTWKSRFCPMCGCCMKEGK